MTNSHGIFKEHFILQSFEILGKSQSQGMELLCTSGQVL